MFRYSLILAIVVLAGSSAHGQWQRPADVPRVDPREESTSPVRNVANERGVGNVLSDAAQAVKRRIAKVTAGGNLPTDSGQVWKNYDITPYTFRVNNTTKPEQAVVDWVLRDTGYEAWHSDPLGVLSADNRTLKVYHTPAMHDVVQEIVDRFVNTEADSHAFGLRVMTIDTPNWRAVAHRMMVPVPVQTQGVQAWLLEKEHAALLLAEARKRSDFREHSSPHLLVNNGQSTVVSSTRPLSYVKDVVLRPNVWPGFEAQSAQLDEGFSIELNPLMSLDGSSVDAIIKCNIDQVERLQSVNIDVPTAVSSRQRTKIEVPQVSHCRLHERFHWPINQVLLVSLGVVATPTPTDRNPNLVQMALAMPPTPPRADLLVVVEHKGRSSQPSTATAAATTTERTERTGQASPSRSYRGRY